MSTLYVAEFPSAGSQGSGVMPVAPMPPLAEQVLTVSGTSAKLANAFKSNTRLIRVTTDGICSIAVGLAASIVATTSNMRMVAGQVEYFEVPPGFNIAAITNT